MSPFLKLNLVCILKLFREKKKISIEVQSICFENRTFPGLFALGAARSLAGARCAEGTSCHISHSISPAAPLSLTLEEPPGWQRCDTASGSAGDHGDRVPPGRWDTGLSMPMGRTG